MLQKRDSRFRISHFESHAGAPPGSNSLERGAEELVCPQCGKAQIDYGGDFQLHASEAALNSMGNYFRTEAIFGGGNFLSPIHIVTQALYRALTERGMTRGLRFTPVVLF